MWLALWALWASLAAASPWDVTFEPEQERIATVAQVGSRAAVFIVDKEVTPAANALCGALASQRVLCDPIPVKGRSAKIPDYELAASQRPDGTNMVYVVALVPGSKNAALVSAFDATGNRLDWYVAVAGQPVLLRSQLEALNDRVKELESRPSNPSAPADPSKAEEAAEILKEATAASEAFDYTRAKALIDQLNRDYSNTRASRVSQRLKAELDIIGKPEIPLALEYWFQGQQTHAVGQPTLYVFCELWCPHCKREIPKIEALYQRYQSRGFQVLALTKLTRGKTSDEVEAFLADHQLSFPVAKEDASTMSKHYGVSGIPAVAMVVDGAVVWRGHPAKVTDEMLEQWLTP